MRVPVRVVCYSMHTSASVTVGTRGFELDHPGGFGASPWAAVLGHHAAASIMQTGEPHAYGAPHHPGGPMDLHMPQAFPYYR